jgi:hypothetical protein
MEPPFPDQSPPGDPLPVIRHVLRCPPFQQGGHTPADQGCQPEDFIILRGSQIKDLSARSWEVCVTEADFSDSMNITRTSRFLFSRNAGWRRPPDVSMTCSVHKRDDMELHCFYSEPNDRGRR